MNMKFTLRDTQTGEVKTIDWDLECADDDDDGHCGVIYIWESGNMSCDCNRLRTFYDQTYPSTWVDYKCSDGRVVVELAVTESGKVLCRNDDWDIRG